MFIFMIPLSFGLSLFTVTNTYYNEDYEYTDTFANKDYTFSEFGCSIAPNTPYNFSGFGRAFGWNVSTTSCATPNTIAIKRPNAWDDLSAGRGVFSFDFYVGTLHNSHGGGDSFSRLTCGDSTNVFVFGTNSNHKTLSISNFRTGGASCSHGKNLTKGEVNTLTLDINFYTNTYTLYLNNDSTGCNEQSLGTDSGTGCLTGFEHEYRTNDKLNVSVFFDNTFLGVDATASAVNLSTIGDNCLKNSECSTGKCEYGICAPKIRGESCAFSGECLSGECQNGKCTKASLWQRISISKTQQFGNDGDTNNFIALFFIIGIPALILWAGHKSRLVVVSAIAIMFALSFFFAMVGWLSFFIVFGLFISSSMVFFALMIFGGSSN